METLKNTVPAPQDFGNALIGAEEGDLISLNLRLESLVDGILVSGTAALDVNGECSMCLDPVRQAVSADIQELFVFERAFESKTEDEEEQYLVEDDYIDLEPILRDAVITQLPFQPLCKDSCQGLCSHCGIRLEEDPGHHHGVLDPRWKALAGMFDEDK